jgi:hypothetical protein
MDGMIASFKKVKETGERDKNEPLIKILRWIDTIHDFYAVNTTGRGKNIREILSRRYDTTFKATDKFNEKDKNGIKNFLDKLGKDKIGTIALTTVEVGTENFYKNNFKTITVSDQAIDVKEIINKYGTNSAAEVLEQFNVPAYEKSADLQLCLNKTDRDFFKDTAKTNFLADVILTFFLGENKNRDVYFLIDAAYGRLDCMFQKIDQASTLINVLTIGDSALTSVEDKTSKGKSKWCGVEDYINKFKRKVYLENPDTIPYTNGDRYDITSNEFTKDKFKMWYQDAALPFSKQNNASARLYVQYGDKTWFSEFSILASGTPNSGASVSTLKQLIMEINENAADRRKAKIEIEKIYKYETQFNLTPILCGMLDDPTISTDDIISFLYDYKRAGDHEQANSANYLYKEKKLNVILLTGDRLCALYARLINQPCIFFHDGNYDMYRYLPDVSIEEQNKMKNIKAKKLLESRRTFILAEIGKVDPPKIQVRLDKLSGDLTTLIERLANTFEDKLYEFVFESLLKKIEKMKVKRLAYASEQKKLQDFINALEPEEETDKVEEKIKELNDEYNAFYTKNKELFDFALYPDDVLVGKKDKFNSDALGYDNKIVKNILNYFTQFNKSNIRSDVSNDKRLAIKINLIRRIGGAEYKILVTEFLEYLKKCNSYRKLLPIDEEEIRDAAINLKIEERIEEEIKDTKFGDHTYETYKPIFDDIKEFITKKIGKEAEVERDEAADAIADVTLPEELAELEKQILENEKERLNLMKISLYDWFKQKKPEAKMPVIEQIYQQRDPLQRDIPWTERKEQQQQQQADEEAALTAKITELDATINKGKFKEILDSKLEDEYHIFYDANDGGDDLVPMDIDSEPGTPYFSVDEDEDESMAGGAEPDYIKKLLANYYETLQFSHYQELVDMYLSVTEDNEEEKKGKIGQIYNYITETTLYPKDVYEYLYKGCAKNPVVEKSEREQSEVSRVVTKRKRSLSPLEVPDVSSPMEESSTDDLEVEMLNPVPEPEIELKRKRSSSSGERNIKKKKSGKSSSGRVPSMGISRRGSFAELSDSVPSGGNRTRRNKNKRNKRTRHQRKKTRKNKTLKKKRGKGKRTRRISI